jgi:hypothetical protein
MTTILCKLFLAASTFKENKLILILRKSIKENHQGVDVLTGNIFPLKN